MFLLVLKIVISYIVGGFFVGKLFSDYKKGKYFLCGMDIMMATYCVKEFLGVL